MRREDGCVFVTGKIRWRSSSRKRNEKGKIAVHVVRSAGFGPPMATWPCECGWEEENEGVKVGEGGILFYCGGVCV